MARESDFRVLRMWPRHVLAHKDRKSIAALQRVGVYILYRDDEPYYVGKATNTLFQRLHDHAVKFTDRHYPLWNYFSCFAFDDDTAKTRKKIDEIEGILIAAMPRASNSSTPRWPKEKVPKALREDLKVALGLKAMTAKAGK